MRWPPKVGPARHRKRKRVAALAHGAATKSLSVAIALQGSGVPDAQAHGIAVNGAAYVCHYCERSDGARTRDHKLPRRFGGTGIAENIVRCCHMCNIIKGVREYTAFVAFFAEFLREHGDEYRAADPDNGKSVRVMRRKFDAWLHALQHVDEIAETEESVA